MMVSGVHRARKRFIFNGAWSIITGQGSGKAGLAPSKGGLVPAKAVADPEGGITYRQGIDTWAFFFWLVSGRYPRAFFVANQYGDWINYGAKTAAAGYLLNKYGLNKYRAAKKVGRKLLLRHHLKPTPKFAPRPSPITGFGSPFGSAGPTFFLGAPIIINSVLATEEMYEPYLPEYVLSTADLSGQTGGGFMGVD